MKQKSIFEHSRSAGGVVVNKKDEVLVVRQNGGVWSLPKGHVVKGENDVDAAKREIYEEAGIKKLEFVRNLGEYDRYRIGFDGKDDKSCLKTIAMVMFKTSENILQPVLTDSHEAKWVKCEEVTNLLTHPKDKEFFLSIKEKI